MTFDDNVQHVHERFLAIEPPDAYKSSRTINCLNDAWMRCSSERTSLDKPGKVEWSGQFSRWALLKASLLFQLTYSTRESMCWHVAGRQLLHLKASIVSGRLQDTMPMLVVPEIFGVLRPDNRAIKRLTAANQAAEGESLRALEEVTYFDEEGTVIDDA